MIKDKSHILARKIHRLYGNDNPLIEIQVNDLIQKALTEQEVETKTRYAETTLKDKVREKTEVV